MFCNCNPESITQKRRDELIWELKNIFDNKPCGGFIHKCSCEADCKSYQHVCFGKQHQHYCSGTRINKHALKWIKLVGCYSYEGKNGDNK
jgi:hypothetical protein